MQTLYTSDDIDRRMTGLADEIIEAFGTSFTMVPVLTGGFVFAADLARALYRAGADPEIDFIQLSSYGSGRVSSGEVQLVKDVTASVTGQRVLIVDDVLDSGRSVSFVQALFKERDAQIVKSCVAIDKTGIKERPFEADFSLFDLPENAFLVGYGMDDAGGLRGLPSICALPD